METHLKDKKRQRYPSLGMDTQLRRELLDRILTLCWTFWGTVKSLSVVVRIPFYISKAMCKDSNFFTSLPRHFFRVFFFLFFFFCVVMFYYGRCEVTGVLWFWFTFHQWLKWLKDAGLLFLCLLAISVPSLKKYLLKSFA